MRVEFRWLISFLVLAVSVLALAGWVGSVYADVHDEEPDDEPEVVAQCPKTLMTDQDYCFRCHTHPAFKLKESELGEGKLMGEYLISRDGTLCLRYRLGDVEGFVVQDLVEISDYISAHPGMVDRLVIDILSPGGSLFHAWDIVGLFGELRSKGVTIETRCRGFAASAAFLIFASGDERIASPSAEFMWHELRSWAFFEEKNPSRLEDQARIYRHLQDTTNNHLVKVSGGKVKKAFLDESVDKDELWLTGAEMLELGLADRLTQ